MPQDIYDRTYGMVPFLEKTREQKIIIVYDAVERIIQIL